jgi:hypothetical protein
MLLRCRWSRPWGIPFLSGPTPVRPDAPGAIDGGDGTAARAAPDVRGVT